MNPLRVSIICLTTLSKDSLLTLTFGHFYGCCETVTVWFKPLEVWEVTFGDLTLSRVHTAAAGLVGDEQGRGVALRFPRFVRRRPDKSICTATTSNQIAQLYLKQTKIVNKGRL